VSGNLQHSQVLRRPLGVGVWVARCLVLPAPQGCQEVACRRAVRVGDV
jgi:hypothetical protein